MRYCFIHAADLHLDTPFRGIGDRSERLAAELRDASLEAWDGVVALAMERRAAFVLLAGDIYDGAERGLRAQLRFKSGLDRLSEAGIETLIVHGNHDPLEGWGAIREWPHGVHVFGADEVARVTVERDGTPLANVYGVSFQTREEKNNLALRFHREDGPGLHVGLLHANAVPESGHAAYSPCSVDDLVAAGMDYWALGHIHKRSVLREGDPWIVYPGNTQGRSAKPSERGPKGVTVVEVESDRVQGLEFVPVDRVRFLGVDLDIADLPGIPAIRDALAERAAQLIIEHAGRTLILRAQLTGRGPAYSDLRRPDSIDELLAALRDEAPGGGVFGGDGGVWWDKISNAASAEMDVEELVQRADFPGEIARLSEELLGDPQKLESYLGDHLAGLTKLEAWLSDEGLGADADLLRAARDTALDLLIREDEA
ncbi:MAG: metallophosphoesterase family protein [Planctomycetota bacterium]|jgi:DNA repair exonuclease SbcCD nuclease subunit